MRWLMCQIIYSTLLGGTYDVWPTDYTLFASMKCDSVLESAQVPLVKDKQCAGTVVAEAKTRLDPATLTTAVPIPYFCTSKQNSIDYSLYSHSVDQQVECLSIYENSVAPSRSQSVEKKAENSSYFSLIHIQR